MTEDARASEIPAQTLAAKVRELLPEIDRRLAVGIRHKQVVAWLREEKGIEVCMSTFRDILYRWRRAQGRPPRHRKRKQQKESGMPKRSKPKVPNVPMPENQGLSDGLEGKDIDELTEDDSYREAMRYKSLKNRTGRS